MDRFICHAIQSCRECTWTHRGMQARRRAEDEATPLPLPPFSPPIDEQWFTNKQKPPPMSRRNALTSWPINWNHHHPRHCNRHCHHHRRRQQPSFEGALAMATCSRKIFLWFWHFLGWWLVLGHFFLLLLLLIVINFSWQQWCELSSAFR